ncbi:unnamed protein product, partial [Mesorhabditis belari]|uniref:Uncharacterized protein n=1 Tax=Mesorhabditis belari TaxID=2138241 RepID=A0AAF3ETC5_9BILA
MPTHERFPLKIMIDAEEGEDDSESRKKISDANSHHSHHSHVRFIRPVVPKNPDNHWTHEKHPKEYLGKLVTAFYCLFIVIMGIVMELSNLITVGYGYPPNSTDLVLALFLYGGSILFIGYALLSVLKEHISVHQRRKSLSSVPGRIPMPEVLTNVSTGSMYLRIGCIVFGIIGVVYYGMVTLVCALGWDHGSSQECSIYSEIISILAAVFIFVQMWFVFCNGKITFLGAPNVARLGLMHLVATNLWMWLRYILYEEAETVNELQHASKLSTTLRPTLNVLPTLPTIPHHQIYDHAADVHLHNPKHSCEGSHCVFGEYSEFMYTCVVEYSLICVGVAFVFWTSISSKKDEIMQKLKKHSVVTMDCSRSAEGLFGGFLVIITSIISIALFNAYSSRKELAQWIFLGTNATYFIMAIAVTFLAFHRMRVLKFNEEKECEAEESAELLDQILLVVGLIGELVYCIGGILAFANNSNRINLSYMLFGVHVLRLVQVSLQSGLIMIGGRLALRLDDEEIVRYKPGKQIVTLMLMVNCALFLMNIFEAQKAGITEEIVALYGHPQWALLIRGTSPLTIFYRFHSSACFAEIWKKTFKRCEHVQRNFKECT